MTSDQIVIAIGVFVMLIAILATLIVGSKEGQ